MENEIEKCLMTKAYNKALNKNRKWKKKCLMKKTGMPQNSGEIHYSALTLQATGLSLPNR
jgi:hypothetical protein